MRDPQRWLDGGSGDEEIRQLLEASRQAGPSIQDKAALATKLGVAPGALWLTPSIKLLLLGGAVALGGGAAWLNSTGSSSDAPPPAEMTEQRASAETQPASATPPSSASNAEKTPPTAESTDTALPPSPSSETVKAQDSLTADARQLRPKSNASPSTSKPPSEASLLRSAREALQSNPSRSLSLLDSHRKLYPKGALSPERDMLRLKALRALGEKQAADKASQDFEAKHPQAVHHLGD